MVTLCRTIGSACSLVPAAAPSLDALLVAVAAVV